MSPGAEEHVSPSLAEASVTSTSTRSPVPNRKQLIAMQQSEIGGSAVFIAKQHEHYECVAMLERAASGEEIPFPESVTDSLREASIRTPRASHNKPT